MKSTQFIRRVFAIPVFTLLSLIHPCEGFSQTSCTPTLVEQFTMTFTSFFTKSVNVNVGETYYFTVSGVMNFFGHLNPEWLQFH